MRKLKVKEVQFYQTQEISLKITNTGIGYKIHSLWVNEIHGGTHQYHQQTIQLHISVVQLLEVRRSQGDQGYQGSNNKPALISVGCSIIGRNTQMY